jgi:hypothetical protein
MPDNNEERPVLCLRPITKDTLTRRDWPHQWEPVVDGTLFLDADGTPIAVRVTVHGEAKDRVLVEPLFEVRNEPEPPEVICFEEHCDGDRA